MAHYSGGSAGGRTGRGKVWGSWWEPALRSPFTAFEKVRGNPTGLLVKGDRTQWDRSLREPLSVWPEEIKVPKQQPSASPARPNASVSTLANGLKVVSVDARHPLVTTSLFLSAGAAFDHPHFIGTSHFLKNLAFQANWSPGPVYRSGVEFCRALEERGATLEAELDREHVAFRSHLFAEDAGELAPVLAGLFTPELDEWQITAERERVGRESAALETNPQAVVVTALHREAFRGQPLANPLHCPHFNVERISQEALQVYASDRYAPNGAVFVGLGFEHAELVKLAERAFGGLPRNERVAAAAAPPTSSYVGGESVQLGDPELGAHVAIAHEGLAAGDAARPALAVLQQVLGRAVDPSLAKARPGTGRVGRLADDALFAQGVAAASAFSLHYRTTGLFGIYAQGSSAKAVTALAAKLKALADAPVTAAELDAAKRRARAATFFDLELRASQVDWHGLRALHDLPVLHPEEFAAQLDSVSAADLQSVARRVLGSKRAVVAFGDVATMPRLN